LSDAYLKLRVKNDGRGEEGELRRRHSGKGRLFPAENPQVRVIKVREMSNRCRRKRRGKMSARWIGKVRQP